MINTNDPFQTIKELAENPIVIDFQHHMSTIASFSLPPSLKALFDNYHNHCFDDPLPSFTKDWGLESPNWKWQRRHNESIFHSAQSATAAVFYHSDNLLRMERELLAFRDIDSLIKIMGRSSFGGGNTQKLDFEYHAFVFAFRRTLDYMSTGIAAIIKEDCKSYNKLIDSLNNHSNKDWIIQIKDIHSKYARHLTTFVHPSRGHSTRDKITHHMHVPVGCLNVNAQGVFFEGGGENIESSKRLEDVITNHVRVLQNILTGFFLSMSTGLPKKT